MITRLYSLFLNLFTIISAPRRYCKLFLIYKLRKFQLLIKLFQLNDEMFDLL